jgi:hypothetical protein
MRFSSGGEAPPRLGFRSGGVERGGPAGAPGRAVRRWRTTWRQADTERGERRQSRSVAGGPVRDLFMSCSCPVSPPVQALLRGRAGRRQSGARSSGDASVTVFSSTSTSTSASASASTSSGELAPRPRGSFDDRPAGSRPRSDGVPVTVTPRRDRRERSDGVGDEKRIAAWKTCSRPVRSLFLGAFFTGCGFRNAACAPGRRSQRLKSRGGGSKRPTSFLTRHYGACARNWRAPAQQKIR